MGAFEYVALDTRGKQKKGVIEGDTPRQVRQQLRDQGLTPLNVEEVVQRERSSGQRRFNRTSVSASDLALATRQLATLMHSGTPLEETLQTVARQSERPRVQSMLLAVRARVLEGHTLATGLGDFPNVFPELYRATVSAGEQSGHLDVVLERLADYTEARQQMRQKILLATFYPALLTLVAITVVLALLAYVVPQVVQVFANTGQELPFLTRALIAVSDFLRAWGIPMALLLVAVGSGVRWALKKPHIKERWHRFQLKLPVVARLIRGLNSARFARTFSILAASGVPVLEAMRISAQVMSNLPMREAVAHSADRVREGASISGALNKTGLFPPMMVHLIASGESSGKLEAMLERAAANQERELEGFIAAAMGLFEPLLILAMGAVVLVIVLAILLPIFELNQLVS